MVCQTHVVRVLVFTINIASTQAVALLTSAPEPTYAAVSVNRNTSEMEVRLNSMCVGSSICDRNSTASEASSTASPGASASATEMTVTASPDSTTDSLGASLSH